jgi:hypothetical protein
MRKSMEVHCFYRLPSRTVFIPHIFPLRDLVIIATKIYGTLKHFEIQFDTSSSTSFHVLYLFSAIPKIILFYTCVISPLKLFLTPHNSAFTAVFLLLILASLGCRCWLCSWGLCSVCKWAVLPTFRRHMLPPSPESWRWRQQVPPKVGNNVNIHTVQRKTQEQNQHQHRVSAVVIVQACYSK